MGIQFINDPNLPDIVELKDIKQVYPDGKGGEKVVIDGLNLLIEDKPNVGEFVVLLGKSGCGKSTVLRYIAGLQAPTSGDIIINEGQHMDEKVSMVFQQYSSLPWLSVLDNVMLGLKFGKCKKSTAEKKDQAMSIIEEVGLIDHWDKYAQYPNLSGGQLQRVAIARCLITNPKIILMDEPFGALDVATRLDMQNLLADIWLKHHPTIVFVTHDLDEAVFLGDDVYILSTNPAKIQEHIKVTLPSDRHIDIKRERRFIDLKLEVEDKFMRT